MRKFLVLTMLIMAITVAGCGTNTQEAIWPDKTTYHHAEINGHKIFYREAGNPESLTILMLHGFPSSSHTYRELIPLLSGRYHVIAPDNLGSGYSDKPDPETMKYNFDVLAQFITGLIATLDVDEYAIYMQDFGAPVGFRVMMHNPSKVKAIIAQNANAYLEGIPEAKQAFFNNAQLDQSPENFEMLYDFTSADAVKNKQYLRDVQGKEEFMSPDSWTFDSHFLEDDKERRIQIDLFQDYKTNLDSYPQWQAFLREYQIPTLLVWGKNDPVFMASGARAYLKDVPDAELHLLDAGHFAAEEMPVEIAKHIINFMERIK
jgi:pimeloyl-ACP methyl ester carboxylesterase